MFEELKIENMKLQEVIEDISLEENIAYMTQAYKNNDKEQYEVHKKSVLENLLVKGFNREKAQDILNEFKGKTSISEVFSILSKYNLLEDED